MAILTKANEIMDLLNDEDDLIHAIYARCNEFCVSSDGCDCSELAERVRAGFSAIRELMEKSQNWQS